eukprot:TRINITY_DN1424_c0_g1_i2.p1 TRINITY_DN1424_c0_g1~~TRINITY_DN1424_c0_g1_i2.p1  ORF type:complete len:593 (-),score=83.08 TRINITY_DN1424_c0_g1_i2:372-2102(-)
MCIRDRYQRRVHGIGAMARVFRVARGFRVIRRLPRLRAIFNTLLTTLPSLGNIAGLLFLVLFIYSVLGMNMFPYIRYGNAISRDTNFHGFFISFITLIRVATGDDWAVIVNDCQLQLRPNNVCFDIRNYEDYLKYGLNGCGTNWSYIYFVSFIIIFSMVILNLFVAVILEAFAENNCFESYTITLNDLHLFRNVWKYFDPRGTSLIYAPNLDRLMNVVDPPLGWNANQMLHKAERSKFLSKLRVPVYRVGKTRAKFYHYYDLLLTLVKRSIQETRPTTDFDAPDNINVIKEILEQRRKILKSITDLIPLPYTSHELIAVQIITKHLLKRKKGKLGIRKDGRKKTNRDVERIDVIYDGKQVLDQTATILKDNILLPKTLVDGGGSQVLEEKGSSPSFKSHTPASTKRGVRHAEFLRKRSSYVNGDNGNSFSGELEAIEYMREGNIDEGRRDMEMKRRERGLIVAELASRPGEVAFDSTRKLSEASSLDGRPWKGSHEYPMNSRPSSDVLGTETRLMQIGEEEDEELKLHPEPVVNNSGLDKQNKDDEVNSGDNITSNIARDGEDKEPKRAGENYASK